MHQLNLGLTTSHSPVTPGRRTGPDFWRPSKDMYPGVLPPCHPVLPRSPKQWCCRVVALLSTTTSTHPWGTQCGPCGPCSSVCLLGEHQCLSEASSTSHGLPLPLAPLPMPGREGSVWGWQPALTHCPPGAAQARCPPPMGAWRQGFNGVCPPLALGEHDGVSPCCHARRVAASALCWGHRTWFL